MSGSSGSGGSRGAAGPVGYILRRLLLAVGLLFALATVTFWVDQAIPYDPGLYLLRSGTNPTAEQIRNANELLGVDPFLKLVAAAAIVFLSFALVGLATGLGARYPRFGADASQAAGSYGGIAFMILAVMLIIVSIVLVGWPSAIYMNRTLRGVPLRTEHLLQIGGGYTAAVVVMLTTWWLGMRSGIRALNDLDR